MPCPKTFEKHDLSINRHLLNTKGGGGDWNHSVHLCIHLSVHSSVNVSNFVPTISPEPLNQKTKFGLLVYYYEAESHEQKLVHYPQCQGHSKGL